MGEGVSFTAIKAEAVIPKKVRDILVEIAEEADVFGHKCYVILETDYKTPWNNVEEEEQKPYFDWLEGAEKNPAIVFHHYWS